MQNVGPACSRTTTWSDGREMWGSLSIMKRDKTGDLKAERSNLMCVAIPDTWGHGEVPSRALAEDHV